jgi:heat shock protein HslJ
MDNRTLTSMPIAAALGVMAVMLAACSAAATPSPSSNPPRSSTPAPTAAPATAATSAVPASATPAVPVAPPTKVPTQPSASAPSAGLEGRTFLSVSVDGHDFVQGTTVRLTFTGGGVSVNAGCNSIGGSYTISGNRLTVGQVMSTEMACDPALMAQDQWIAAFLASGPVFALDGPNLTLTSGGTTLRLRDRTAADPDRPLEGTRWVVDGIVEGNAVSSVPAGLTASITIENGRASVEPGCNTGSATVTADGDTLVFGPLGLTKKMCEPDAMKLEQAVVATLSGTVQYRIEADVLTLNAGSTGLTLRAAPRR